ncbi:ankyrin repeat and sterile alpha motif domain-containing protein 1B-like [Hydractinia symbiolongicarpus]|uniref:ankyrin repeat and sterile alpha motif domain-containing protein 1B-like n=1 Tax=Hydractinia symbiolongicarpus TaxID=13093 RepID=UPI0025511B15|nr:ankyrin repeat and sterile alpha motif domain-containing protein 1B-like [Hydractinia symbiolongicarpus]
MFYISFYLDFSFELYKNMQENTVVRFDNESYSHVVEIKKKNAEGVTELQSSNQYHQKNEKHQLVQGIRELQITLSNKEGERKIITINDMKKFIFSNNIVEMEKLLISNSNIVHMTDEEGHTPLMVTANFSDNPLMVQLLVAHGGNIWAMNTHGANCYHLAAMLGHHQTLKVLCQNDVTNINCTNDLNRTALHYAVVSGEVRSVEVLLRQNNIDTSIRDAYGRTARDVTGYRTHQENREKIIKMIENHAK